MTETARKGAARTPAIGTPDWSHPREMADRYLLAAGISLPEVREALIQAAADRLELENRSSAPHVRGVRMLACVERVLCERMGATPGSDTTHADTARRRLLFAVNPTLEAQRALLEEKPKGQSERVRTEEGFVPIPEVSRRKRMPRQHISFRLPPFWRPQIEKGASR